MCIAIVGRSDALHTTCNGGASTTGSPDGPNYRPQAALREEYRQPRAYAANPGTAAREHAGQEVGRGDKRHCHKG